MIMILVPFPRVFGGGAEGFTAFLTLVVAEDAEAFFFCPLPVVWDAERQRRVSFERLAGTRALTEDFTACF